MPNYQPRLHVILHEPEIPQNTGNIGRTCVAVGAKLWLVQPLGFRLDEKNLRRPGLDYWKHLEWEVVDTWESVVTKLVGRTFWYFTKTATRPYTTAKFQHGDVLVFGSETKGLPAWMLEPNRDSMLRIPIRPEVRSLNLANSVAIAVYEAIRQWDD